MCQSLTNRDSSHQPAAAGRGSCRPSSSPLQPTNPTQSSQTTSKPQPNCVRGPRDVGNGPPSAELGADALHDATHTPPRCLLGHGPNNPPEPWRGPALFDFHEATTAQPKASHLLGYGSSSATRVVKIRSIRAAAPSRAVLRADPKTSA